MKIHRYIIIAIEVYIAVYLIKLLMFQTFYLDYIKPFMEVIK